METRFSGSVMAAW